MNFDYFNGTEAESYSFVRLPRRLMTGEEFKGLSSEAKLLYALMLDRMSLSMRSGWLDEEGRVYIYYTLEEIQADLNCGHDKAIKLLKELDTQNGIGLIERIKQGRGKPAIIYVRKLSENDTEDYSENSQDELRLPESRSSDDTKQDDKTSEKENTGLLENGSADFGKSESNYTDINYTKNSYTDPSIYQSKVGEKIGARQRSKGLLLLTKAACFCSQTSYNSS